MRKLKHREANHLPNYCITNVSELEFKPRISGSRNQKPSVSDFSLHMSVSCTFGVHACIVVHIVVPISVFNVVILIEHVWSGVTSLFI